MFGIFLKLSQGRAVILFGRRGGGQPGAKALVGSRGAKSPGSGVWDIGTFCMP